MASRRLFSDFASRTARLAGKPPVVLGAMSAVVLWALTGPLFHFSDTWQLVINTTTSVITFLMVFLIQNSQNRDNAAIQAKLDELIIVGHAENRFVGIEHMTDDELDKLRAQVEGYSKRIETERTGRRKKKRRR